MFHQLNLMKISLVLFGHDANFRSDDVLDLIILLAMALCLYLPM